MTELEAKQANEDVIARIEALLRDNHALTRSLESERDEKSRLLAAVARTEGENAALRESIAPVHAMTEAMSAIPDALADQCGKIDAIAEGLSQLMTVRLQEASARPLSIGGESSDAAEQLHAVLTSRSWRITRPMRGVGRMINRLWN